MQGQGQSRSAVNGSHFLTSKPKIQPSRPKAAQKSAHQPTPKIPSPIRRKIAQLGGKTAHLALGCCCHHPGLPTVRCQKLLFFFFLRRGILFGYFFLKSGYFFYILDTFLDTFFIFSTGNTALVLRRQRLWLVLRPI